jgi:hypothetical protein
MRGALGRTVLLIRQQLSPWEREIWFECASRKLDHVQESFVRPTRRKPVNNKRSALAPPNEELLIFEHQLMSEEEQDHWRNNILRNAARLFERPGPIREKNSGLPGSFFF